MRAAPRLSGDGRGQSTQRILTRRFSSPKPAVLKRTASRPRLRQLDRVFWALIARLWSGWRDCFLVVKPDTVVAWHRAGFRLF